LILTRSTTKNNFQSSKEGQKEKQQLLPAECLEKDRDVLLAFYDFPAEHWKSIRTLQTR